MSGRYADNEFIQTDMGADYVQKEEIRTSRNFSLETDIQDALDSGNSVWVVGDIHGHFSTFEKLLSTINMNDEDKLLSLGDLVDRGPDSASVLRIFMEKESFHLIRGNHEDMMLRCLCNTKKRTCKSWLKYGGEHTLNSFDLSLEDMKNNSNELCNFLSSSPTQIVLNKFILLHAGINPERSLDQQTDNDRLWSRNIFSFAHAPDPSRQVIVGHTPTQDIDGHEKSSPYFSSNFNADGLPSIIGLDTGICKEEYETPSLTAFNLQTARVVSVKRIEQY